MPISANGIGVEFILVVPRQSIILAHAIAWLSGKTRHVCLNLTLTARCRWSPALDTSRVLLPPCNGQNHFAPEARWVLACASEENPAQFEQYIKPHGKPFGTALHRTSGSPSHSGVAHAIFVLEGVYNFFPLFFFFCECERSRERCGDEQRRSSRLPLSPPPLSPPLSPFSLFPFPPQRTSCFGTLLFFFWQRRDAVP